MKRKMLDHFWTWVKMFAAAGILAFLLRAFIFIPFTVDGISMENTLTQGDHVIMEKFSEIKRFDVIVFELPSDGVVIKRVIALPGERISYKNDHLYINGKKIAEPFLKKEKAQSKKGVPFTPDFDLSEIQDEKTLGKNEYFVLGDNRRLSKDSRTFGAISVNNIIGKAILVYYPFKDFQLL